MWVDKGLYWSLVGSSDSEPEPKTIFYSKIKYPDGVEMEIATVIKTGDKFETVNYPEIKWHTENGAKVVWLSRWTKIYRKHLRLCDYPS